jgi:hypothetical protein
MKAETIARALGGRKAGDGWIARCPCHDDREPSLSIHHAADGKLLAHCHAGCEQGRVIAALRLRCGTTTIIANSQARYRGPPPIKSRIATTPNTPNQRSQFGAPQSRQRAL